MGLLDIGLPFAAVRDLPAMNTPMLAYLVIREGTKWSDVFRLIPGRTVTVGRTSTNQIVIKDERCSRYHAELFLTQGRWTLRDLESRNGTIVGSQAVHGDYPLSPGDVIRIANCQMAFVHDLSLAFQEARAKLALTGEPGEGTVVGEICETSDSHVLDAIEPTRITHRRGETRFLTPQTDVPSTPGLGRAATQLCRLAFHLANQTDVASAAKLALEGLFEGTHVDAGAVLLGPRAASKDLTVGDLEIAAARSDTQSKYHRISTYLAGLVLREGEAVLARNVEDDGTLGTRDSQGEIESTSVICAPIRQDKKIIGLVHLYATRAERTLDPDDLEFTLAVADNMALALKNLARQQELAEHLSQSHSELVQLRERLGAESEIVGSSPLMQKLQQAIAQAAPSRATVLIRGESGVGKELVARAIHFSSPRKKGPYVCMNCAALSETLLESELFGHEKGAFTGSTVRKIGKFEAAHQGTLMMDEIGEMSPSIQAKFLRVLEGHPFERVGGSNSIKVDVRVLAATNRDLEKDVAEGKFRRDLYFRLNVVEIIVPPLRKRSEDLVKLAKYFLDRFNSETGKKICGFTSAALDQLQKYRWPGNVRELKNVIERAVVLARHDRIDAEDLTLTSLATASDSGEIPLPVKRHEPTKLKDIEHAVGLAHHDRIGAEDLTLTRLVPSSESGEIPLPVNQYEPTKLKEIERRHILATLHAEGWNKSRTAAVLGIERSTLDRKIRSYQLKPQDDA
ncbi:MAG: sigma 54-interacting transcriptional regulator [Planctomycetota bacterium]|nr:sigma 54-interacting transcriptional regulator [Planctomycetota bacterium]